MLQLGRRLVSRRFSSVHSTQQLVRIPINLRGPLEAIKLPSLDQDSENASNSKGKKSKKTKPVPVFSDRGAKPEEGEFTSFYKGLKDTVDQFPVDEYVVLIQVGSFYELYFQQAETHATRLGLTLTKKALKQKNVPFAGFPDIKLDKYLQMVFKNGLKAVVCDQQPTAHNIITRPVTRLLTPGTIVDEELRDYHRTNYLLSVQFPSDPFKVDPTSQKIGLCWVDVGLSEFNVLETTLSDLMANITRINPKEILVNDDIDLDLLVSGKWFPELAEMKHFYLSRYSLPTNNLSLHDFIDRFSDNRRLVVSLLDNLSQKEASAAKLVLNYLHKCLPYYKLNFGLPTRSLPNTLMHIDPRAAQDLELTETIVGGFRTGALASIVDKTCTVQGSRLLNTWLLAPSTDVDEIRRRQRYVERFIGNRGFVEELTQLLRKTTDLSRIVRRTDNRRAEMGEYLELGHTILIINEILQMVKESPDKKLVKSLLPLFKEFEASQHLVTLANEITDAINPQTLTIKMDTIKSETEVLRKIWSMNPTASAKMVKLRAHYDLLEQQFHTLCSELSAEFEKNGFPGSFSLVRDLQMDEFIIDVRTSRKTFNDVIENMPLTLRDRNKSSAKLWSSEWQELGIQLVAAEAEILREEERVTTMIRDQILSFSKEIRLVAPIIEFLDVCVSFYRLATEKGLVRPVVDKSTTFAIEGGRHLVVEEGLKGRVAGVENFTANDCSLRSGEGWVITGPNMGGKSTFLRQNALIAILAQIGSFVPAKSAHIGVIDKVFTRVGASDNIYRNQSSFMVEMNETAIILRDSTERSMAIVDELGRGTSSTEGISIAFASLSHLMKKKKCKVLFATHYGPEICGFIKEDKQLDDNVSFYQTSLSEVQEGNLPVDEKLVYDHKLMPGISYHSHAFEVAQLAGFPADALKVARDAYHKIAYNE